jgi:hypothetical protein
MSTLRDPLAKGEEPVPGVRVSRSDQAQSPFFNKLPAEVRISIYRYLIKSLGKAIHIQKLWSEDKIGRSISTACRVENRFEEWEEDYHYHNYTRDLDHRPCLRVLSEYARQDDEISKNTLQTTRPNSNVAIILTCSRA